MGNRGSKLPPEVLEELVNTTHFTQKEVLQWYRGFQKDCPNGVFNEREFCRIYRQFFPFGDPSVFASFVFRSFDANEKGFVEFKEFLKCLSITSRGTAEERLEWSFRLYDINHDGYISRDEMISVVDSIYRMVGQFVEIDSSIVNTPQERVKNIFEIMDGDGDGLISLDDFIECSKRDPIIVKSLALFDGLC